MVSEAVGAGPVYCEKGSPKPEKWMEEPGVIVTEIERTELVNRLVDIIGEGPTETLMKCVIPDGRNQVASKDDLRVLEANLRGYIDSTLAKQTRLLLGGFATVVGFMITIWATLLVQQFA